MNSNYTFLLLALFAVIAVVQADNTLRKRNVFEIEENGRGLSSASLAGKGGKGKGGSGSKKSAKKGYSGDSKMSKKNRVAADWTEMAFGSMSMSM
jgi:hypothetical protein